MDRYARSTLWCARYERDYHRGAWELTTWARAMRDFPGGLEGEGREESANGEHSTNAQAKMTSGYFTRRSLERLLRYYSIDYVELNLPLPSWLEHYH